MSESDPVAAGAAGEPVDPDVTSRDVSVRLRNEGPVVLVVAVGGVLGSLARYGAGRLWPTATGTFPWTTFGINVLGCALIGVLLVLVTEAFAAHRLLRPLLGTGVLGGFTTFSTYAVDIRDLISGGRPGVALAYLVATVLAALAAVTLAVRVTRRLVGVRR